MLTVGTFNTLDGKGTVTPFADILLLTEAVPRKVRRELSRTHYVYVCRWQRDLAIAIRKTLVIEDVRQHYRLVHPGIPLVTPHRGEFWLTLRLNGQSTAIQVGHWINAAFPPYKRGEAGFRRAMWRRHQRIALKVIARHIRRGRTVYAGGDLNTPRSVLGYDLLLHEVGSGLDRLGSTRRLTDERHLDARGSDHRPLKATAR